VEDLRSRVIAGLEKIVGRSVGWNENLLAGAIDSLALVEVINLVDELRKTHGVSIDLDALISGETLTAQMILESIELGR
jgi:aryl carrier-like protein